MTPREESLSSPGAACQAEECDQAEPPRQRQLTPTARPDVLPQSSLVLASPAPPFLLPKATGCLWSWPPSQWRVLYSVPRSGRCRTCPLCVCFQSRLPTACLLVLLKQPHGGITDIQ